jgi:hypothetical protein
VAQRPGQPHARRALGFVVVIEQPAERRPQAGLLAHQV